MNWLWSFSFLLFVIFLTKITAKPSLFAVVPKHLDVGKTEKIKITLFDIEKEGKCSVQLFTGPEVNKTQTIITEASVSFENGGSKYVDLPIPSVASTYNVICELRVICDFQDYHVNKSHRVLIRQKNQFIFINTDKPFYKEGQTVKFRVLIINQDLRPPTTKKTGDIWINDPNRIRIAQWKNVSFDKGLVQRELQLPEEPVLGSWSINIKIDTLHVRSFTVKEYVLPTFEVTVTPPSYILQDNQNITWKVCAKYTYGKPVQGNLTTRMRFSRIYRQKAPVIQNRDRINGCKEINIVFDKYMAENEIYSHYGFELTAEVIEDGTGNNISSSASIYPSHYPFTISHGAFSNYFKPGLPVSLKISVKQPDSQPKVGELIQVCATSRRENWKNYRAIADTFKSCKNFTTDDQGEFVFTIPSQNPNTITVNIQVDAVNIHDIQRGTTRIHVYKPSTSFTLTAWYSAIGSHLQIEPVVSKFKCGETGNILVKYTTNEATTKTLFYQIMSRGETVYDGVHSYTFNKGDDLSGYVDDTYLPGESDLPCTEGQQWDNEIIPSTYVGQFDLKIDITPNMAPKSRLVIYSINDAGNVTADSTSFEVEPCLDNKVELKFGQEVQQPGSKTSIDLLASPQSLCSVGIIDKSVYLLNKGDQLTPSSIYNILNSLDVSGYSTPYQPQYDYDYCAKKQNKSESGLRLLPPGYVDAITAFSDAGVIVISDLELETRPCKPDLGSGCYYGGGSGGGGLRGGAYEIGSPGVPASASLDSSGFAGESALPPGRTPASSSFDSFKTTTVRTYFPETWLWSLFVVGDDGELVLKETMPDTITEWQGHAVCANPDTGVGISETATIVAFQPFFASITLPYSIVRGETLPVIVTVSNYLKECLAIKIHLDQTDNFELLTDELLSKSECICGDATSTVRFLIKPTTLGEVNITVTAATSKDETICENFDTSDLVRSDTITKPLLVEAEGFPKEEIKNTFFCMEDFEGDNFKLEHDISIGEDTVEGSSRAYVSLTGDLLGPTLEGLDNLVRLPTGCGEQNMVRLVPNIVVLDYLEATNRLTESIKDKAIKNIEAGVMRQQKYRHYDGSYSAFGSYDPEGSMWLTAFTVRSFASAGRHVLVDKDQLQYSRNWIISRQLPNGCFPVIGTVHNQALKGGVREDKTPATLTAYVLASLLESGTVNDSVKNGAWRCIQALNNPTDYSLALFAYAAALANDSSTTDYLDKLFEYSKSEDRYRYWKNKDKSIAIETAAYAILTILRIGSSKSENVQKAGPMVLWLTQQRNSYGGFSSTQDTVVALRALGQFASLISRNPLDMEITVKSEDFQKKFQLNEDNELLTQRTRLPLLPTTVDLEASGKGCALVQNVLRYNVPKTESGTHFDLTVQAEGKSGQCRKAEISICASYKEKDESNMVVMEIKMVSGFVANKESVEKLLLQRDLEIRRFEITDNMLNLYFVQLTKEERCFSFDVTQEFVVEDRKPSTAVVYDYYDQEKTDSVAYSIEALC